MNIKERILALLLLEHIKQEPEIAESVGIEGSIKMKPLKRDEN